MGNLVVIKVSEQNINVHKTILDLIEKLESLDAIFFMGEAVSLCKEDNRGEFKLAYVKLAEAKNSALYVCGRALTEHNIDAKTVDLFFNVTGYVELAAKIHEANKVFNF